MGKLLCEKLSSKMPGVVKQATRALCNMWCCPEVVPEVREWQWCMGRARVHANMGGTLAQGQCWSKLRAALTAV